jgi:hypothetical protein
MHWRYIHACGRQAAGGKQRACCTRFVPSGPACTCVLVRCAAPRPGGVLHPPHVYAACAAAAGHRLVILTCRQRHDGAAPGTQGRAGQHRAVRDSHASGALAPPTMHAVACTYLRSSGTRPMERTCSCLPTPRMPLRQTKGRPWDHQSASSQQGLHTLTMSCVQVLSPAWQSSLAVATAHSPPIQHQCTGKPSSAPDLASHR